MPISVLSLLGKLRNEVTGPSWGLEDSRFIVLVAPSPGVSSEETSCHCHRGVLHIRAGDPKQPGFVYKKSGIPTCFNLSHLLSPLPLMQCTFRDLFPLLQTVFELMDLDAF